MKKILMIALAAACLSGCSSYYNETVTEYVRKYKAYSQEAEKVHGKWEALADAQRKAAQNKAKCLRAWIISPELVEMKQAYKDWDAVVEDYEVQMKTWDDLYNTLQKKADEMRKAALSAGWEPWNKQKKLRDSAV